MATPDLWTITGPAPGRRRQALAIAAQAQAAGTTVFVVGDILGEVPDGYRRLDAFPRSADERAVVFSPALRGESLRDARHLIVRSGGRAVPVLVDDIIPARFSIAVEHG